MSVTLASPQQSDPYDLCRKNPDKTHKAKEYHLEESFLSDKVGHSQMRGDSDQMDHFTG